MAEEDLDLDVKSGSKLNTILLIALIVTVLAVGGVGAALFLMGGEDEKAASSQESSAEKPSLAPTEAHYIALKPEFVVNFEDSTTARFLQIEIRLMARNADSISVVEDHMPVIRNNILLLLSSQKFEELNTRAGKEKLQADVLAAVNGIVLPELKQDDKGKAQGIDTVYFTSLIMQ